MNSPEEEKNITVSYLVRVLLIIFFEILISDEITNIFNFIPFFFFFFFFCFLFPADKLLV